MSTKGKHWKRPDIAGKPRTNWKLSPEVCKAFSKKRCGSGNPMYGRKRPKELSGNWKGGITEVNHNWRRSTKWKEIRRIVIIRDEFVCKECGIKDVRLDIHHIKPYRKYPELQFEMTNLITYCKECHKGKFNESD